MVPKTPSCYCMLLISPPDLNFLDPYFIFMYMHNNHCHRVTAHLRFIIIIIIIIIRAQFSSTSRWYTQVMLNILMFTIA